MTKGQLTKRIREMEVTLSRALEDRAMWDKSQPEALQRNQRFADNLRETIVQLKARRAKL